MKYQFGNIREANATDFHGWIVGHMAPGIAKTGAVEVKLWYYDNGLAYPKKKFLGTECIVIFGGQIAIDLEKDGQKSTVSLIGSHGDYLILGPSITKHVKVIDAPAFGVTVRWPSEADINKVVP